MDNKKQVKQDKAVKEDKCKEKEENLMREIEEYKGKYLRALADYQNFERRVRQEKEEIRRSVNRELILELLPFLDNLEKAEVFMKDPGLKMIRGNFYQIIKNIGLEEIEVLEKEFDPAVAEAVDVVEGERDNIIIDVMRKGYRYNNKLLRPAQVKVEKKKIITNLS